MLTDADELRHAGSAVESWCWWGWNDTADVGLFVGLELRGMRFDYVAGLVRRGHPYLYVEELDGVGLRAGLELKPPEMWAGHSCDAPFRQWSLGNEAHGVLIDEPDDVFTRPFGEVVPVTFDVEWYADGAAHPTSGGYEQAGSIDARIELREGVLEVRGPGRRVHRWRDEPLAASPPLPEVDASLRAPHRRSGRAGVEQVLTERGFLVRPLDTPYGGTP